MRRFAISARLHLDRRPCAGAPTAINSPPPSTLANAPKLPPQWEEDA